MSALPRYHGIVGPDDGFHGIGATDSDAWADATAQAQAAEMGPDEWPSGSYRCIPITPCLYRAIIEDGGGVDWDIVYDVVDGIGDLVRGKEVRFGA